MGDCLLRKRGGKCVQIELDRNNGESDDESQVSPIDEISRSLFSGTANRCAVNWSERAWVSSNLL